MKAPGREPRRLGRHGQSLAPRVLPQSGGSPLIPVTIVVGVLVFLYAIREVLLPFVLTGIVAYVCSPLIDRLVAITHWPRWTLATAVLIAITAVVTLALMLGVPTLAHEIQRVSADLPGSVERLAHAMLGDRTFHLSGMSVNAASIGQYSGQELNRWLSAGVPLLPIAGYSLAAMSGSVLTWVLLAYFLLDAARLAAGALWLVPPRHRPFARSVGQALDQVLRRYFIGVAAIVVYATIAAYIGLGLILGLHHAAVLAVLTGLFELVPIVGPIASGVLAGLVAVQQATSPWSIITYVIYVLALRFSIDQFLGPIILGKAARLPPVVVIFSFLAGGVLMGLIGVILAIPVALSIKIILQLLYEAAPPTA
jgi:predicted PurR-regulated permease PerM